MTKATSENNVSGFLEFELIRLAERINVSGNLTDAQIQAIAKNIIATYPNETIADFKICFEGMSNGKYIKQDKLFKLDGSEIGYAIGKYLDEKYQVLENELMKEKDTYQKNVYNSNTDWLKLWEEAIKMPVHEDFKNNAGSRNMHQLSYLKALNEKEINSEGQEKPKRKPYPTSSAEEVIKHELHLQYIRENYDARTADKKPNWLPEKEWIDNHLESIS